MSTLLNLDKIEDFKIENFKFSYSPPNRKDWVKVTSSLDVYEFLKNNWTENIDHIEEFGVIYLNNTNKIGYFSVLFKGGVTSVIADPYLILQGALLTNSTVMILVHNHPSGNLKPSVQDRELTKKIVQCAKLFGILVVDHLIITSEGYFSFLDNELL